MRNLNSKATRSNNTSALSLHVVKEQISMSQLPTYMGRLIDIFDWLRDLIEIYTWREVWIAVSVPGIIMGVWFLFTFMLRIQNVALRTASIWALIIVLTAGSAATEYTKKRKKSVR